MPLVQIKVFEDELTTEQASRIIGLVTDAIVEGTHEKLRLHTWVVIEEVRNGHWGIGGQPLGLDDVKRIIAS